MSKKLTLSSILAIAAMASLAVLNTLHQRAANEAGTASPGWEQEAALPKL